MCALIEMEQWEFSKLFTDCCINHNRWLKWGRKRYKLIRCYTRAQQITVNYCDSKASILFKRHRFFNSSKMSRKFHSIRMKRSKIIEEKHWNGKEFSIRVEKTLFGVSISPFYYCHYWVCRCMFSFSPALCCSE